MTPIRMHPSEWHPSEWHPSEWSWHWVKAWAHFKKLCLNIQQNGAHQKSHQMTLIRMTLSRMSVVKSVATFQRENMALKIAPNHSTEWHLQEWHPLE